MSMIAASSRRGEKGPLKDKTVVWRAERSQQRNRLR